MNQLPLQCRIMRQTLSNLTTLPHRIQTAVPNWFRRRSFAGLNSSIRFGTWVERPLNRALITWLSRTCFPPLAPRYRFEFLCAVIGSYDCLILLWLAKVTILILVLRQSWNHKTTLFSWFLLLFNLLLFDGRYSLCLTFALLTCFWQDSTSRNMISKLQKCMHTSAANTMRWKFSSLYIFQRTLSPPFPLVSLVHLKVHLTPKIFFRYNNIAGKITECWLVNEESIFSLILLREEGKITRSRLVLRSPSNSSFNREVVFLQQWRLVSR